MDERTVVLSKLRRYRAGEPLRTLDLFAGCGGLSLGFHRAGYHLVGAVENDPHAIQTHARNFFGREHDLFEKHATPRDIGAIDPSSLLEEFNLRCKNECAIDFIIGGPPCQAFARVGRAKLREIDQHPEAFLRDARSNLYLRYLQYVRELLPLGLLMENVPDVMNFGGHNVAEEVCEVLDEIGYVCRYTLLNSAFYGVPQMRERMFLIAFRKELDIDVSFPAPSHWIDLPPGYEGSRNVALRVLVENGYLRSSTVDLFTKQLEGTPDYFYSEPPNATQSLPRSITTEEALRDLAPIDAIILHRSGELKRGVRRFDQLSRYSEGLQPSSYGLEMRNWPEFESEDGVFDHVIRSLPRDFPIFAKMKPGDQYPEAFALAHEICEIARRRKRIKRDSQEHTELIAAMVPPYDPDKFPNKWRKLESYLPSRTLTAHIGKDTYSHIHYDDRQARTISVREAARLQSFPDGFTFAGTMNPAFRQIGNAVPPLLAYQLAEEMKQALGRSGKAKSFRKCLSASV
jgi:DNA (cytosine-5)-methyltransferase 1